LADHVEENLPGAPTDWKRTNLYPGEGAHVTSATSYGNEASAQADEAWSWIKRKAGDAIDETKSTGKWLLIGGGVFLGIKGIEYLDERERRRDRSTVARSPRHALETSLERAASRNAQPTPETMCPVCHRYHFIDTDGRLIPHEYPISDVCPGSGRLPLSVSGAKAPRKASASVPKAKASAEKVAPQSKGSTTKTSTTQAKATAKKSPKVRS
jgi:hypothetical protein